MPMYTAEIAGWATFVFGALDDADALAFASGEFILGELKDQLRTPRGAPLWDGKAEVTVRPATADEVVVWERELYWDVVEEVYESLEHAIECNRFVFLVDYLEPDE